MAKRRSVPSLSSLLCILTRCGVLGEAQRPQNLTNAPFRGQPTPIYLLDEVDAALDFRNVSIVANYIKARCAQQAQFIVISLRNVSATPFLVSAPILTLCLYGRTELVRAGEPPRRSLQGRELHAQCRHRQHRPGRDCRRRPGSQSVICSGIRSRHHPFRSFQAPHVVP